MGPVFKGKEGAMGLSSLARSVVLVIAALLFTALPSAQKNGAQEIGALEKLEGAPIVQGRPLNPSGELVMDRSSGRPAVASMPVRFVRSPDAGGPGGGGRYLISVNSGFGVQFSVDTNRAQQSLSVIDLVGPLPVVVQNVYFPSPQSAQVGAVFDPVSSDDGTYTLYISGGFENRIWIFRLDPDADPPLSPVSPGPDTRVEADFIALASLTVSAATEGFNGARAPVYPLGLALSPDGNILFTANNLGDSLGLVRDVRRLRVLQGIDLRRSAQERPFPYDVVVVGAVGLGSLKAYVSCWGTATIAVVDLYRATPTVRHIEVLRHPTQMVLSADSSRLYVVNSNADTVSVIDTGTDREVERIGVGLAEDRGLVGASPEGLALSADGRRLYVANSHSHSLAVVALSATARNVTEDADSDSDSDDDGSSRIEGFVPTGIYPTAVAVVDGMLYVGNGKGTGFENSSLVVSGSGRVPNAPNDAFPAASASPSGASPSGGNPSGQGGQYVSSLMAGNISRLEEPFGATLAEYTRAAMEVNGLVSDPPAALFETASPIRHVIYVIKENRTYDQVFGDLSAAGNGEAADGDPSLAIFGAGGAAQRPGGPPQDISPNHRALALRFGLLDRFFVNAEASPDGHNWSTAAFSSDYIDKAYRWSYSRRGRSYDYGGFNRRPAISLTPPVTGAEIAGFMKRYLPYLQAGRDIAEPESLYLWDAAARAGLSYRNYGEFIGTVTEAEVEAFNSGVPKTYPDVTPNVAAMATKKSLEGHFSHFFRNFDMETPDSMTPDSYLAAVSSGDVSRALVSPSNPVTELVGTSRIGVWLQEFDNYVEARQTGAGEELPNLSIVQLPSDHTAGLSPGMPTPQFYMAENDYAVGLLVEAVSNSPYWIDTAIFVLEDDAQNGPDHVDAHRSPALVISAYNRPGELIHEFHTTVSLIRTIELLLGIEPMNILDATANPIDIFQAKPDLTPYSATLPKVAPDNLWNPGRDTSPRTAYWIDRTLEQNLEHLDMADPGVLNQVIWFSVRGEGERMPQVARLPAFEALRYGIDRQAEQETDPILEMRMMLANRVIGIRDP